MEKTSSNTLNQLLTKRYSPRSFSDQPVETSTLHKILDAARLAPSSFNEQPWRFIYATKAQPEEYLRLLSCLNEKNQRWADEAPVLIVGIAKKTFTAIEKLNRHAWYDTGAAVGFMTLKATEENIYMHQMAGFMPQKAVELLHIPEEYEPVVMIALGYRGEAERPDKGRKPLEEIAFRGEWKA
ncbi:nitroreductase family protein [Catalinimonas niigatensis]|uniref:nitroreductase family protein n=1 Tax=Catalinimonas niigatensis TaxID=1397264 RepID=UPI0026659211|nr:nitroreductase family protein [Catalinimonas niigatensis]WPP50548.1 nitroreductase family protein [Catalinimonas niigatensis]